MHELTDFHVYSHLFQSVPSSPRAPVPIETENSWTVRPGVFDWRGHTKLSQEWNWRRNPAVFWSVWFLVDAQLCVMYLLLLMHSNSKRHWLCNSRYVPFHVWHWWLKGNADPWICCYIVFQILFVTMHWSIFMIYEVIVHWRSMNLMYNKSFITLNLFS